MPIHEVDGIPQLMMVRESLGDLPPVDVPPGAALRTFRTGDEPDWETIVRDSFGFDVPFAMAMASDPAYRPDRIFLLYEDGVPAATAAAWVVPTDGADTGTIHMVATRPRFSGKGYGTLVTLAALHRMHEEGKTRAVLGTDDGRAAAVRTYLRLGFLPFASDDDSRGRWLRMLDSIGRDDLAACLGKG